ncbi:uncharacterized protein LOC100367779 [Saccoglossus kowalevskii]|uniref:Uncharacterized protein LOC100367779 n=1 Tax=Saccoglossus kowalevskii TaxID=10224 RepID=A0ABM0MNH2_SACKO|nr:PREDICTED: uncharacterized protein LOC100367779 [Saccoglossus kowalevskii]
MASESIPHYEPFQVHEEPSTCGKRWEEWLEGFQIMMIACDITSTKRQRALLIHYAGKEVRREIKALPDTGEEDDVKKLIEALNKRFAPKRTKAYEKHVFRQAKQKYGESTDQYHARLQLLVANCNYANPDEEVCTQIIEHCTSQRLRRRALREDMKLEDLLNFARTMEVSESHAADIEGNMHASTVNAISRGFKSKHNKRGKPKRVAVNESRSTSRLCYFCGGDYPHDGPCPAKCKKYKSCGKDGHFAKVCRSKPNKERDRKPKRSIRRVDADTDSSSESSQETDQVTYVFGIRTETIHATKAKFQTADITIHGKEIKFLIDTGAAINIMDESDFEKLNGKVKLRRTYTKVFPYKSQYPIETLGEFRTDIKCKTNNGRKSLSNILVHVVKRNGNFGESLLSFQTAEDLGLVQIIKQVGGQTVTDKLVSEYNDLFTGLGKMTDFHKSYT